MFRLISSICLLLLASNSPTQPATIISVSFEGNQHLTAFQLKRQLRLAREGNLYLPQSLAIDLKNLESFYRNSGFLRAEIGEPDVRFRDVQDGSQGVELRIPVSEGPLYALGKLEIRNASVLQVETLLQMAPIGQGQPYSREKIYRWIGVITGNYHSMGYIRFSADLREEVHDFRRVVDCSIDFHEGSAHRVRKIMVAGDPAIRPADFKRQLLLGEGSVYDPQMLSHSIEYLNRKRIFKPLTPGDVEIRINEADSTVDLVFHVTPLKKPSSD